MATCPLLCVLFLATLMFRLCSPFLILHNELKISMECVGNFEMFHVKPNSSCQLFGNGRCATEKNDGNQSLVEWNFAETQLFLDISLVDACTFGAEIMSNGVLYSYVRCSCVSQPSLSECSRTRLPEYCCLGNFNSENTCNTENTYFKSLNSCSVGVYKYAYDDASGLKTFPETAPVYVSVYDDNLKEESKTNTSLAFPQPSAAVVTRSGSFQYLVLFIFLWKFSF